MKNDGVRNSQRQASTLRRGTALALAAATLALAGCGGSGGASHTVAGEAGSLAQSRSEVIAHADAICARLSAQIDANKPKNRRVREVVRVSGERAVQEREAATELAHLAAPASLAQDLRQIVAYRMQLAQELDELSRDAQGNDIRAIRVLAKSKERAHAQLSATAKQAGIAECAEIG
jgi:hypothetical protein